MAAMQLPVPANDEIQRVGGVLSVSLMEDVRGQFSEKAECWG